MNDCFVNIYRVLNPKGKLLILEFSEPENIIVNYLFKIYLNYFMPFIGWIITAKKGAYIYLKESINDFNLLDITKELSKVGFSKILVKNLFFGTVKIYSATVGNNK